MPTNGPASHAAPPLTPSRASPLLQGRRAIRTRRSRLAGEQAGKPCSAPADAFAGQPAPTRVASNRYP
ncbi:hypothetical protein CW358_29085 [Pseudomonas protegens]|nr:hypothetical protein CW358_29085 [Pseudomonas protegens]